MKTKKNEKNLYTKKQMYEMGFPMRLLNELVADEDNFSRIGFHAGSHRNSPVYFYLDKTERFLENREDDRRAAMRV